MTKGQKENAETNIPKGDDGMAYGVRFFCLLLILSISLSGLEALAKGEPPLVRIGVVLDGPPRKQGWGKVFVSGAFQQEIKKLTKGDFNVQFPKNGVKYGQWSPKGVKQAVDALLKNPKIDVVLALGVLASNDVAHRQRLPKPTIAPFIINRIAQGLPFANGTSGVKNLNYLVAPDFLTRDIHTFKEIISFQHLSLVIDQNILKVAPDLRKEIDRIAKEEKLHITLVPVGASVSPILAKLSSQTEAVLLTPLSQLPVKDLNALAKELANRRLPAFSMFGREDIQRGFFATGKPQTDVIELARRVALNVQHILTGQDAGQTDVIFSEKERLIINMATVKIIDKWPSFRVLTEAELINDKENGKGKGRQLSLQKVVQEAVEVNLELAAADRRVAAGLGEVNEARADLFPKIDVGALGLGLWTRTGAQNGGKPDQAAFATGSINQSIYSDDIWTNYTVQKKVHDSTIAEREQLRLDIIQRAAIGYLNVLRAQTVMDIVMDDLKLTRVNLERARTRESVGQAAKDEVYRWQSEIAKGRIDALSAQAEIKKAKVALNRLLNRPLNEPFYTKEATLDDPHLITSQQRLRLYIDNPRNFDLFRDFQVQEGVSAAPELHRVTAIMEGKAREMVNAKRAYWAPDITAGFQAFQKFAETAPSGDPSSSIPLGAIGLAGADIKTVVSGSIGLTFPLYEGGSKNAKHLKTREELRQLQFERKALKDQIEERINMTLYDAGASFESINLSQESAEAEDKNLTMVLNQYANGTVDIIKLINTQNSALVAKQLAANAVFEFLIDLMKVQRAVGRFDYFTNEQEQNAWFKRLESFFEEEGVKIR